MTPFRRLTALTGFAALTLALTLVMHAGRAAQPPAKDNGELTQRLTAVNKSFRAFYARTRKEVLARQNPVILAAGDELVLLRQGKRVEVRLTPKSYDELKIIAHIPLAVYVMLGGPEPWAALTLPRVTEMQKYRAQVEALSKSLDALPLQKAALERQHKIVKLSLDFLDRVEREKKVDAKALQAYTRATGPLLEENVAAAAAAQVDALHTQVTAWKKDMSAEEWKKLRVIVQGSSMPRQGNINVQYFARVLGVDGEGPRILYAEALFEEERALQLLGTQTLDTHVGTAFFDDPRRMHRDVLSDGTKAYLEKMKFAP